MTNLLKCLVPKCELDAEGDWSFEAGVHDAPIEIKTAQLRPLLLQAIESAGMDIMFDVLSAGADPTTTAYRMPDGQSTGITALHAVLLMADPVSMPQAQQEHHTHKLHISAPCLLLCQQEHIRQMFDPSKRPIMKGVGLSHAVCQQFFCPCVFFCADWKDADAAHAWTDEHCNWCWLWG